jgi:hypothetical protein
MNLNINKEFKYERQFSDGKYNGGCKLFHNEKLIYEGQFSDEKYNGEEESKILFYFLLRY